MKNQREVAASDAVAVVADADAAPASAALGAAFVVVSAGSAVVLLRFSTDGPRPRHSHKDTLDVSAVQASQS